MLFLWFFLLISFHIYEAASKDEEWIYEDRMYVIFNYHADYFQTIELCSERGMRPLTILSKNHEDFLSDMLEKEGIIDDKPIWTSGTKLLDDKHWIWLALRLPILDMGKMNNNVSTADQNKCLSFQKSGSDILWTFSDCLTKYIFVCESEDKRISKWTDKLSCHPNFQTDIFRNSTYFLGSHIKLPFFHANLLCRTLGMALVSIETEEENEFISHKIKNRGLFNSSFWSSGICFGDSTEWFWLPSGEKVNYNNWLNGHPEDVLGQCLNLHFTLEDNLVWRELDCSTNHNFICEYVDNSYLEEEEEDEEEVVEEIEDDDDEEETEEEATTYFTESFICEGQECNAHQSSFQATNYYIGYLKVDFIQAFIICHEMGMQLATIQSTEINDFLIDYIIETMGSNYSNPFWTSGTKLIDNNHWIWLSIAQPVFLDAWTNQKINYTEDRECLSVKLMESSMQWINNNCEEEFDFICQSPNPPNHWNDDELVPNFGNYFTHKHKAYYLGQYTTLSYFQASTFCRSLGMKLVSIDSEEENNFLYEKIRSAVAGMSFWTDGISLGEYGWFWISYQREVNYTNWASNVPNIQDDLCIQLQFVSDKGLFWNSADCYSKFNFVCEISDYDKDKKEEQKEEIEDSNEEIIIYNESNTQSSVQDCSQNSSQENSPKIFQEINIEMGTESSGKDGPKIRNFKGNLTITFIFDGDLET